MSVLLSRRQTLQLGVVIVGGWAVSQVLPRASLYERDLSQSGAVERILQGAGSPTDGPRNASVRLAVFADYFCPACRRAFPAMEKAVRSDGDVRVIYKDWPILGPQSVRAARLALASAEQGIYSAVHRRLMTGNWINERSLITDAGGDWKRVMAYMTANEQSIAARLHANGRDALEIGLTGTPGYLAGPKLVAGAISESDFQRLFAHARSAT
ncbi:DsbA family protein [Novosphingobium sp. M1R2S20]|uniref:Thioredoxin domain-containing protein n=1 Tax=Novosphingobium rhizovicinum TaxID=3228928 RepID=A0ABV3RDA5_9SPHN